MNRLAPIALVFLLLAAVMAGAWHQYRQFTLMPLSVGANGLVVNVRAGDSVNAVLRRLEDRGVTQTGWRWRVLNRLQRVTIQAGEYMLEPGITPTGLLQLLSSGKVVNYRFTIVEGWTVRQLLSALARDPVLEQTLSGVADFANVPGLPAGNAEGWFLPETYLFVRGDSDVQLLRRAHVAMRQALEQTWARRDIGLPYETDYEMLTMASIIEKETSVEAERDQIAGVFVRRLAEGWRLEADPTVIYGMGEAFQGDIRRGDLDQDTPYNTYRRRGLPPTPIALPGLASLQAAAHPAAGQAMFFVADGQGGHTFSVTLEEHNEAVQRLLGQAGRQQEDP
jgi:UPF0755 protein